jgi:hypothetical protein
MNPPPTIQFNPQAKILQARDCVPSSNSNQHPSHATEEGNIIHSIAQHKFVLMEIEEGHWDLGVGEIITEIGTERIIWNL